VSPEDPRHGRRSGYLAGCPCDACNKANRVWVKEYRYRALKGGGSTTIDAAPVRQHLLDIAATMSLTSIEVASGISRSTVRRVRLGEIKRLHPRTAHALLGVQPYQEGLGGHYIDARGTRRRLQALHALGYSLERIEKLTGFSKSNLRQVIFGERRFVFGDTADKVRAAYEIHSMRLPEASNRVEQGHITKARNRAQANGWPPPLAWDSIDNDPDPSDWEYRPATRAEMVIDLDDQGAGISTVCQALDITRKALERWSERNDMRDVYVRLVTRENQWNEVAS
jgi:hypothetical protein